MHDSRFSLPIAQNIKTSKTHLMEAITKKLREKLERLPTHEAYIFQFYYKELFEGTLDLIDVKVGSALHLRFLISESKKDQDLLSIHSQLKKLNFGTFSSQCKRMVVLARESLKAGLNPDSHLPAVVRGKHPSIADSVVVGVRPSSSHVPKAPYTKGTFEWYDFDRRPMPGIVKVEAHRYLLPCVVEEEDLNYTWLAPDCLEVSMRYPDLINHPIELVELVTSENGEPVFHAQHEILRGFEKDLAPRRETKGVHKGSIMDPFVIKFECDQDTNFVALNSKLKGFDLIDAKYLSRKGKICEMKILQIVTREKSEDEGREGTANAVDCSAVVLGMSKSTATTGTFTPFSSPQSFPASNNAQQTAFALQQQQQQQALMKQQQALLQQQEAWKQKELEQQQAVVQQQQALKQKELEQQYQQQAILQREEMLRQALKQKELEQQHEQQAILQREEALRQHEQQQQQQQQTTQQELEYLRRQLESALMMTEEAKQASTNMETAARTEVQAAHHARAQLETAATAAVMQAKGDADAIHQAATAAVMQAKIDADTQAKLQIEQAMRNLQHHQGDRADGPVQHYQVDYGLGGFHGADGQHHPVSPYVKIRNDDDMSTVDGAAGAVSVLSNMSSLFSAAH
jgi:hypothetical protein